MRGGVPHRLIFKESQIIVIYWIDFAETQVISMKIREILALAPPEYSEMSATVHRTIGTSGPQLF